MTHFDNNLDDSTIMIDLTARRYHLLPSDIVISAILGIIIGASLSIGGEFYHTAGAPNFGSALLWLSAIAITLIATFISLLCLALWNSYWRPRKKRTYSILILLSSQIRTTKPALLRITVFIIILVLWIPAAIAFFPGNYSSDAPLQLHALFNNHELDAHWPLAHTLVLAGCMQLGQALFSNLSAGVFIYCIIQALLLAFALSLSLQLVISWGCPPIVAVICHFMIIINPYVQTYVMTTSKDSMFASFFIMTLLCIINMLQTPTALKSLKKCSALFFSALGMSLMRKQGLYIFIIVFIILFFARRMKPVRWQMSLVAILVLSVTILFPACLGATFTIRENTVMDQLSLPSQQIVATYMYDHAELSKQDIDAVGKYYDLQALDAGLNSDKPWEGMAGIGRYYNSNTGTGYLEPLADPSKAALISDAVKQDMTGYVKLYFSFAIHHPYRYLTAMLWDTAGYIYPTSLADNRWSGLAPWNEFNVTLDVASENQQPQDYHQSWKPHWLVKWFTDAAEFYAPRIAAAKQSGRTFSGYSLLVPWVSPALVFYVLLISCALICSRRKFTNRLPNTKHHQQTLYAQEHHTGGEEKPDISTSKPNPLILLIAWGYAALYWCSLLLAPVMCGRYIFPLFISIPTLLCLPWITVNHDFSSDSSGNLDGIEHGILDREQSAPDENAKKMLSCH